MWFVDALDSFNFLRIFNADEDSIFVLPKEKGRFVPETERKGSHKGGVL